MKKNKLLVENWNLKYPEGIDVLYSPGPGGQKYSTKTRSAAFISNSGEPVVFLEGVSGYCALSHVAPGKPRPAKSMECNSCGYSLKLNNLHKRSLPVPEEGNFYVVCAACAGIEKRDSKNAEKTWVVEKYDGFCKKV